MERYRAFLKEIEEFIFVEDSPEKSDVIFIPGNGYPHMAERAAQLYKENYAPYVLPSGKYSVTKGCFSGVLAKKRKVYGNVFYRMGVFKKRTSGQWRFGTGNPSGE